MTISAEVDERSLREIYLPAFETAVKKAKPWTVMCAYNKLNGTYGSENHKLLVDILKDEWGFEGFVVSDWGAVHERVTSLKAGLDLEMPGPRERRVKLVVEAVRSKLLTNPRWMSRYAGFSVSSSKLPRQLKAVHLTPSPITPWRAGLLQKAWFCSKTTAFSL